MPERRVSLPSVITTSPAKRKVLQGRSRTKLFWCGYLLVLPVKLWVKLLDRSSLCFLRHQLFLLCGFFWLVSWLFFVFFRGIPKLISSSWKYGWGLNPFKRFSADFYHLCLNRNFYSYIGSFGKNIEVGKMPKKFGLYWIHVSDPM